MSEDKNTQDHKTDHNIESTTDYSTTDNSADHASDHSSDSTTDHNMDNTTEHSIDSTTDQNMDHCFDQGNNNNAPSSRSVLLDRSHNKILSRQNILKALQLLFALGFLVFAGLFVNEIWIEPYRANVAIEEARELYQSSESTETDELVTSPTSEPNVLPKEDPSDQKSYNTNTTPAIERDSRGRLLQFRELLEVNEDVKGWIKIDNQVTGENDTKIDYVVMQHPEDPEYYLARRWNDKKKVKKGSLFLDYKSSVEKNTQNLVIHGHNMTTTDDMFHYLLKYNELEYYKEHPLISFDTIYQTGQWKIFAVFITNGSSKKEELFNFTKSEFTSSSDFLNLIYQMRIRSLYQTDSIDINENDQILTLSTCSYEVDNYRTVIVARKVRDGEDPNVDVNSFEENPEPLYPGSYYYRYGGKAPKLPTSFEIALEEDYISWYHLNK